MLASAYRRAVPSAEGAFARHCLSRTGCGVPRVCACTQSPGRPPEPRPPPLGADAISAFTRVFATRYRGRRPSDCRATATSVARLSSRAGPEANKPPRWSAERRASPGAQTVKASLRGDARTYVTGPPTIPGADAPGRLSALRFPLREEGKMQTSEGSCLAKTMMHGRMS